MKTKINSGCLQNRPQIQLLLDNELTDEESGDVTQHIRECPHCRAVFFSERRLTDSLRRISPLYSAPASLRATVENLAGTATSSDNPKRAWASKFGFTIPQWSAVVGGFCVVFIGWGVFATLITTAPPSLASVAVESHLLHDRGQLPLETMSSSITEIRNWLDDRLQFDTPLPETAIGDTISQNTLLRIQGARLIPYNNHEAAYIAYRIGDRLTSLVIASSDNAIVKRSDPVVLHGIDFHRIHVAGHTAITWTQHGLSYALVVDDHIEVHESCVVCHKNSSSQFSFSPASQI